jgi:RNA polymerase sigma-70 factor (ECF subfamily)
VALLLRYAQDLTYEEIAEVIGQPVGTVKSNVHRGLEMLRREYALEVG